MTKPLILWLLGDGKPGHENQSLGLADALGRQRPCEVHRISLAEDRGMVRRVRRALGDGFSRPDLVIGAGHATHAALLAVARKHRAKSVVLMKPSLPLGWFDLCIAPDHDFADGCRRENVMVTRGALNRVTPTNGEKSGKLILVGGPSKTHGWDGPALLDRLAVATDRGGWELSDSRRTPEGFLELARTRLAGVEVISHLDTPPEWVPENLQQAKEVWVTEDSVSMIYEALTSGARVGLLPVPRKLGKSRVLNGIDRLVADGFLTPFSRWQESHRIASAPETLREADRCAKQLIMQLSL